MNKQIQKIVEDFNFNSIRDNNNTTSFAENALGLVDLGLPSGLLWCKCNLGAKTETDYGDYYAWGELTIKDEYTIENYTYSNKFIRQLPPEADVATQLLGKNYSIPTKKQWEELLKYTTNEWAKNYNGTSVNGRVFIGGNGNTLFFPAAGIRDFDVNEYASHGGVWSSSIDTDESNWVWYLGFRSFYASMYSGSRFYGLSVRPVFTTSLNVM